MKLNKIALTLTFLLTTTNSFALYEWQYEGFAGYVNSAITARAYSTDKSRLVYSDGTNTLVINSQNGQVIKTLPNTNNGTLIFSNDDRTIIQFTDDAVNYFDYSSGNLLKSISTSYASANSSFSAFSDRSQDKTKVSIFNTESGSLVKELDLDIFEIEPVNLDVKRNKKDFKIENVELSPNGSLAMVTVRNRSESDHWYTRVIDLNTNRIVVTDSDFAGFVFWLLEPDQVRGAPTYPLLLDSGSLYYFRIDLGKSCSVYEYNSVKREVKRVAEVPLTGGGDTKRYFDSIRASADQKSIYLVNKLWEPSGSEKKHAAITLINLESHETKTFFPPIDASISQDNIYFDETNNLVKLLDTHNEVTTAYYTSLDGSDDIEEKRDDKPTAKIWHKYQFSNKLNPIAYTSSGNIDQFFFIKENDEVITITQDRILIPGADVVVPYVIDTRF